MPISTEALTSGDFEVKTRKVKRLYFDIETSMIRGRVWNPWKTNLVWLDKDWHILSFAAKMGDGKVIVKGLCDYEGYDPDTRDDKALVADLAKLFEEADIIIGHNGDKFDIRKVHTRMIIHGMPPPPPTKTVDTLKVARKFGFTYNRLGELGKALGLGEKEETGGLKTWDGCESGDPKAWRAMKKYNKQDVVLLEKIYLKFLPWITNHPNVAVMKDIEDGCKACGGTSLTKRGYGFTSTGKAQRYRCNDCGHYQRGPFRKTTDIR
jgi:uncharacterized protein YprB with RNaseH-like and TPR domain